MKPNGITSTNLGTVGTERETALHFEEGGIEGASIEVRQRKE